MVGDGSCILVYPKIAFSGTKITKIQNTAYFSRTHQQMYPHIYQINPATRLCVKIAGHYTVHLPYQFHAAENTVCQSDWTVHQSNHITTVQRTSEFTQVSPFPSMVMKGHFSWNAFLNIWKHLLFAGDGFEGARSIDLAMLSIVHQTFSQMLPWFQCIWLAASLTLQRNFFCFVSFVHSQSTSESKSALFLSFAHMQYIQKWLR